MKIKILFTTTILISLFVSCSTLKKTTNSATYDEGVVINGVRWATRNVDEPGKFAKKPESAGKFYQWNRKKAWNTTDNIVANWDDTNPEGIIWEKSNDPSPTGWRVPTFTEIKSLCDTEKVSNEWTTQNGVKGRKFTDKTSGNSIFLPAVGMRNIGNGKLYDVGSEGLYWISNQHKKGLFTYDILHFRSNFRAYWDSSFSSCGHSVRPVAE